MNRYRLVINPDAKHPAHPEAIYIDATAPVPAMAQAMKLFQASPHYAGGVDAVLYLDVFDPLPRNQPIGWFRNAGALGLQIHSSSVFKLMSGEFGTDGLTSKHTVFVGATEDDCWEEMIHRYKTGNEFVKYVVVGYWVERHARENDKYGETIDAPDYVKRVIFAAESMA